MSDKENENLTNFEELPEVVQAILISKFSAGSVFFAELDGKQICIEIPRKRIFYDLNGNPYINIFNALKGNEKIVAEVEQEIVLSKTTKYS